MQSGKTAAPKRIAIVYFDAASGHRSAAVAVQKGLKSKAPGSHIYTVNITEIFDLHPVFGKVVRSGINYFNWRIKKDKVFDLRGLINLSLLCHDLVGSKGISKIADFWRGNPPDSVVSVTPMYNPVLFKSAKLVNPTVKCITIPVDFKEVCKRYWFTPKVDQYYLNATQKLQQQAIAAGIPAQLLFQMKGMPVDPDAYNAVIENKAEQLAALGLNPVLPTGFLSFGGQGTSNVMDITRELAKLPPDFNMIIMCGKNKKLFKQVSSFDTPFAKKVFDYLPQTPINYLHMADFAIGKPGAMTITEALITATPLIALKSKGMSPVQKGNEDWMIATHTGIVAKTPKRAAAAVRHILADQLYKRQITQYYHHAVLDYADITCQIINK